MTSSSHDPVTKISNLSARVVAVSTAAWIVCPWSQLTDQVIAPAAERTSPSVEPIRIDKITRDLLMTASFAAYQSLCVFGGSSAVSGFS